ncbi:MAG TPA: dihydrofolate reductase family protein [Gaiellaceae bacterium]|nr:dihydrofolate reductase family protein [Gaiellaceae bacterium]
MSFPAQPLELLFEAPGLPAFELPEALARLYPGTLGLPEERLYANFVSSLDGVIALPGVAASNRLIADASDADHFVMALLRACADAILVGSGTLRASPKARWLPESAYPAAREAFAELRQRLGLERQPALAVVTSTGGAGEPLPFGGLPREPIVLTTEAGAGVLDRAEGAGDPIALPGAGLVDVRAAVGELRRRGLRRILCEGGPTLFGSLLDAGLVDELFVTLSPVVAGRATGRTVLALVEEAGFLPDRRVAASLVGVRRSGAHLFLRYAFA